MKKILGCIRRADQDFGLIKTGDRIAIGVSGGKDSLTLLRAMRLYQYFSKASFELHAITLTMGLAPFDGSEMTALCKELGVPYTIRETDIGKIIFDYRKEKNPCALCANLRRGALHNVALEQNCNKVALGHHREDVLETLLLSLFFESRLHTFSPITYLDRKKITVIRPMVYVPESHIAGFAKRNQLPVVQSPCPMNGHTKRQEMKELLYSLERQFPKAREHMLSALKNTSQYGLWDDIGRL